MNRATKDVFLSEEDLDLRNLSLEEVSAIYQAWLVAAASTNDEDAHLYSHGVFLVEPGCDHIAPEFSHLRPGRNRKSS
ncbi:MAG: hypothetical protein J0M04_01515 [Verrucomicrobia bacterium]|nr:hypothetical protein [Verrucomicrobiota bacterium]